MVTLELKDMMVPQPALSQLCQAISERQMLRSLRNLFLGGIFTCTEDASQFFAAVAAGCPGLRRLHLTDNAWNEDSASICQALTSAFRTPDALSRLISLDIGRYHCARRISDLSELAAAISQHPNGLPSLQSFKLWHYDPACVESMSAVAAMIARSKCLKELSVEQNESIQELGVGAGETLASALSPGGIAFDATQHLRKLSLNVGCGGDVRALLGALVAGGCPTLQSMHISTIVDADLQGTVEG